MSYRDELKDRYTNPEPTGDLNKWLNTIESGDLTHAMVMWLVAERDALRAENARLREALERFANINLCNPIDPAIVYDITHARAALKEEK